MLMNRFQISIGMPVYNGEKYVRQTLNSLLTQDYEDFELIISDNASTDRTQEICLEYAAGDKRIRYYRNERNMGAVWNFNRVFELSSGEYFMWASHDDYWKYCYLRSCLNVLSASESIVLAGTMCDSIEPETGRLIFTDDGLSTIGLCPTERFLRYKSTIHAGKHIGGIYSGIYKRSALRKAMPVKKIIANDHIVLAELCFQGEFVTVQERLMVKRWGGASVSHRSNAQALGICNWFFIKCPYFIREILFQRIIFNTDKLRLLEKIRLAFWSLHHYVWIGSLQFFSPLLPSWAKYLIKRVRRIWRGDIRRKSGCNEIHNKLKVKWILIRGVRNWCRSVRVNVKIRIYLASGRKPWTYGYSDYKEKVISKVLGDQKLLSHFLHNRVLPAQYGLHLDERVLEYPWFFARLGATSGRLLLDAGSALNYRYILDQPAVRSRSIVIYNLSPENVVKSSNISYIYGDLRDTAFRNECFDEIVCISTLEHIGMNNAFLYTKNHSFDEFMPDDYQEVIKEFKRLLKPNGKLFITVPYGCYENLGWLQQFDYQRIKAILDIFKGSSHDIIYFKYFKDGWKVVSPEACADCSYFDIHRRKGYESDYVAAARAVACIEIIK